MGVAIISAGGVVLAALIGLIVSVVEANERSSRLLREAEALAKLERGTLAHKLLENHLEQSIVHYAWEVEHKSRHRAGRISLYWGSLFILALFLWSSVYQYANEHHWAVAFWFVDGVLVVGALVSFAMSVDENIRILRERKARKAVTDDEKPHPGE